MKSVIVVLINVLSYTGLTNAQIGQFAVVRPNGTTYICPTWDSAYNKAVNGDNIYMPGITITNAITINKKLYIYGAGHHPDSSAATGKTSVNNNFFIQSDAAGGSIEGVNIIGSTFGFEYTGKKINGFTIKRCRLENIYLSWSGAPPIDSFPTNILITECVLTAMQCAGVTGVNNYFFKNIIRLQITHPVFWTIKNNIFLYPLDALIGTISNCTVENNIFLAATPLAYGTGCNNNYYNNLKIPGNTFLYGCTSPPGLEIGTITVPTVNDIFIAFNPTYANYPYIDNYHLKPTCPGVNGGTDGTDVGIYGTISPTNAGWVPSNPHIYFKQVAPQTNNSGQLNIQFKVRTNN